MLRTAIVNVAQYYLRMAQNKTPAEMEAIIWQHDSIDGADHGQSCAAFASLTLELGAQVVGQQSWVSGGSSYPWPLHSWADVRVGPNPDSLGIISIQQDAQAQHRWHPLGDGYRPRPGDWVLFDGHVEVITEDSDGVLHTVGGDSLPNFSVNAHEYRAPLSGAGVVGFVNNGSRRRRRQRVEQPRPLPVARARGLRGASVRPPREARVRRRQAARTQHLPTVQAPRRMRPTGPRSDSRPSRGPVRRGPGNRGPGRRGARKAGAATPRTAGPVTRPSPASQCPRQDPVQRPRRRQTAGQRHGSPELPGVTRPSLGWRWPRT